MVSIIIILSAFTAVILAIVGIWNLNLWILGDWSSARLALFCLLFALGFYLVLEFGIVHETLN